MYREINEVINEIKDKLNNGKGLVELLERLLMVNDETLRASNIENTILNHNNNHNHNIMKSLESNTQNNDKKIIRHDEQSNIIDANKADMCANQTQHCNKLIKIEQEFSQHMIKMKENRFNCQQVLMRRINNLKIKHISKEKNNIQGEKYLLHNEWETEKNKLIEIISKYDEEMLNRKEEKHLLKERIKEEKIHLQGLKDMCGKQQVIYVQLMEEKEKYLDKVRAIRLREIQVNIAKRKIVKFIESRYPIWKKMKRQKAGKGKRKGKKMAALH